MAMSRGRRDTHVGFGVYLLLFAALLVLNARSLADPPYWDALLGSFTQAVWLARHDMDVMGLLTTQPSYPEGGPLVYPFNVYPYAVALLYRTGLAPAQVFVVLHVVNLAFAALALVSLLRLAKGWLPRPLPWLVTLAFACTPIFQSLSAQMNMDMPLTACTFASIRCLRDERYRASFVWAAFALAIKPTAVILIAANALVSALRVVAPVRFVREPTPIDPQGARMAAAGHGVLLGVFALELWVGGKIGRSPEYVDPLGGVLPLFTRRLWVMPEYGLAFVGFLLSLPYVAWLAWKRRLSELELELGIFLLAFAMFFAQFTNTLPRYFFQSYPALILWHTALLLRMRVPSKGIAALLLLFAAFGVVNRDGRFYPSKPAGWEVPGDARTLYGNDGYILERSLEYEEDLALDRALVESLERHARTDAIVVANWPLVHLLAIPELGYVEEPFRVAAPDVPVLIDDRAVEYSQLYERRDGRPRRRVPEKIVWVLTPNTFSSPQTKLRPDVDRILETVERGRRRAFVVERTGWE